MMIAVLSKPRVMNLFSGVGKVVTPIWSKYKYVENPESDYHAMNKALNDRYNTAHGDPPSKIARCECTCSRAIQAT